MVVGVTAALDLLSPTARRWFTNAFSAPTPVQEGGWPLIANGDNALLLAPTGSGKTLAAFLYCLDRLGRRPPASEPGVRVLYVSPLKALVYDVEKNLRAPLIGLQQTAKLLDESFTPIQAAVRTGDTSSRERRDQAKHPPEILVTTPESLYLILGSNARETLRTVETVIIDEIHSLAPTKRGAHLSLTLERLDALCETPPQRVGLSATVKPIDEVARYMVGPERDVEVVDASAPPKVDLEIIVPVKDMTNPGGSIQEQPADLITAMRHPGNEVMTSIWPSMHPRLLELIRNHTSTICFVNSRGLAERLAAKLNELAEEELVRAHHGSISHAQRIDIEEGLKSGTLKAIVATSSLELGIDMGAVDLVIQVEAPDSVARGLQRVGRAGHQVGEVSVGRIFPKHRMDLLESVVVAHHMERGDIEPIRVPRNPLDVLAQQIVAMCGTSSWRVDELAALVRRTYIYAELTDDVLRGVLDMLAGRYPDTEFSEFAARIVWDRADNILSGRKGSKMLAAVSGGTIPDRGLYPVVLGHDGPRVGELDEEMVHESRVGQTFALGASVWRIEEISTNRVVVSPAPGEPGRLPFWHGDGPGRPIETGRALGRFVRELGGELDAEDGGTAWLESQFPVDPLASQNLLAFVRDQREATGELPTDRTIVVEQFRDELGDLRICILSPFGNRVHAPWALAVEAILSSRAGFEVQAMASDDGIVFRLPDIEEGPDPRTLIPDPDEVEELILTELGRSALFAGQFRENAARALLLPRRNPRGRTPLWVQRMRSKNLLAVAQKYPQFPIVLETYRSCLQDVFDLPALKELLLAIRRRDVRVHIAETPSASPFARSLVFSYVATYLYEGDNTLAEHRLHALTLDRNLLRELLGHEELRALLDADILEAVENELQHVAEERRAQHADQLHDVLLRVGALAAPGEVLRRCAGAPEEVQEWLTSLEKTRRAVRMRVAGRDCWVAAEDAALYRDGLGAVPPAGLPASLSEPVDDALSKLVRRYARSHGPFTTAELAAAMDLSPGPVVAVLRLLESQDRLLEGEFRPGGVSREWCDPDVLKRIRRRTLAKLRGEIAPVAAAALGRFLPGWHGVDSGQRGMARLREVIAQLEGLPVSFHDLEKRILPARVPDYKPSMLDELGTTGELVWVGRGSLGATDGRVALYQRINVPLLMDAPNADVALAELANREELHEHLLNHLENRGASFFTELSIHCGSPRLDALLGALWDLVWAGLVTNDTFGPLRRLATVKSLKKDKQPRRRAVGKSRAAGAASGGRWSAVRHLVGPVPVAPTEAAHARAMLLLERHGVVARETLTNESLPGGFAGVYPVFKALEEAGKIRRGYFVEGLSGAQFALPGAVERLRDVRQSRRHGASTPFDVQLLASCDPANPFGAALSWPEPRAASARPSRSAGTSVVLVDGELVLWIGRSGRKVLTFAGEDRDEVDADVLEAALATLEKIASRTRSKTLRVERIDGEPARSSPLLEVFQKAEFRPDYRGLSLTAR